MSESQVHYFKLLEKKYEIEEDIFKKLGELQDHKKKIAKLYKDIAKDNREREEQFIKKDEYEAKAMTKEAQKCIVVIKKRETSIAQKEYKIKDLENKIKKIEEEIDRFEEDLQESEKDIEAHLAGGESKPQVSYSSEEDEELEPSVLEDYDN